MTLGDGAALVIRTRQTARAGASVLQGGPAGPAGTNGTNGTNGADGKSFRGGSGAPAGGLGLVGDWYLDTATSDVYEKTGASTWTLRINIEGAAGDDGVGIASVVLQSGDHSPGSTDTYRITFTDASTFDFDVYNGANGAPGTGTGDVVGPVSSVAGNIAVYADTTGDLLDDTGLAPSDFATAAQGSTADTTATGLSNHLADTSDAHGASAISYAGGTGMSATDVEAAIDELATEKANVASPTFTGTPVVANAIIGEEVAVASGTSGTVTLNLNTARVFTLSPTGDVTTLTISNWPAGEACTVTLVVDQGGTARTIATPSGGKFVGAASPTQANNKDCIFTYFSADGGTTIYCAASQEV